MPRNYHEISEDGRLRLVRPTGLHRVRDRVWRTRGNRDVYESLPADVVAVPGSGKWQDPAGKEIRVEVDHVVDLQILNHALPQRGRIEDNLELFRWFGVCASEDAQLNVTSKQLNGSKGAIVKHWLNGEEKKGEITFERLQDRLQVGRKADDLVPRNVTREMSATFDRVVKVFNEDDASTRNIKTDQRDDVVLTLRRWRDEHLKPGNPM